MFDKELALDSLHTIASALQLIVERASVVDTGNPKNDKRAGINISQLFFL